MEENQRAIFGGLLRRSMCRWMEGRALKKEQPGMRRVWMIIGLLVVIVFSYRCASLLKESCFGGEVHCQVTA